MTASGEMPCVSVQSEMTYCSRKTGMQWPSFIKLVAIAAVLWPVVTQAQSYPSRPIVMVVPFAAGGTFDVMGRLMASRMSELLGQQVIVENVTGAGGVIGTNRVVNAAPDGYTLLLGSTGTHAYNQTIYKKRRYDAVNDFTPVTLWSEQPMVLETRKDLPANTIPEFAALLKSNGAKMQFGSAGAGSTTHLACSLLNAVIGVNALRPGRRQDRAHRAPRAFRPVRSRKNSGVRQPSARSGSYTSGFQQPQVAGARATDPEICFRRERRPQSHGERIDEPEAGVMARDLVLSAGIAEADDEANGCGHGVSTSWCTPRKKPAGTRAAGLLAGNCRIYFFLSPLGFFFSSLAPSLFSFSSPSLPPPQAPLRPLAPARRFGPRHGRDLFLGFRQRTRDDSSGHDRVDLAALDDAHTRRKLQRRDVNRVLGGELGQIDLDEFGQVLRQTGNFDLGGDVADDRAGLFDRG